MKKKLKFGMLAILLMVIILPIASAELYFWEDTYINDEDSSVISYNYYQLKDTSSDKILNFKSVPIFLFWNVQEMPFNFSGIYPVQIDYCQLDIVHYKNTFNSEGAITNTTAITYNYTYNNTNATFDTLQIEMKNLDYVTTNFECFYNNSDYLFVESIYGGHMSVFAPAFSCEGCDDFTFEELTQKNEEFIIRLNEQLKIYKIIQQIIAINFSLWLIASWIFKISAVIVGVGLIFAGAFWFYLFVKKMGDRI